MLMLLGAWTPINNGEKWQRFSNINRNNKNNHPQHHRPAYVYVCMCE